MNRLTWKGVAELVGLVGVVASLVFVGLQMRQSRDIAKGEGYMSYLQTKAAMYGVINDHADVWTRGCANQPLNDVEATVFRNLVLMYNDGEYFAYRRALVLGERGAASAVMDDYAAFLGRNPGVQREWLAHEDTLNADRQVLSAKRTSSVWRDGVMARVNILSRRK